MIPRPFLALWITATIHYQYLPLCDRHLPRHSNTSTYQVVVASSSWRSCLVPRPLLFAYRQSSYRLRTCRHLYHITATHQTNTHNMKTRSTPDRRTPDEELGNGRRSDSATPRHHVQRKEATQKTDNPHAYTPRPHQDDLPGKRSKLNTNAHPDRAYFQPGILFYFKIRVGNCQTNWACSWEVSTTFRVVMFYEHHFS